MDFSHFAGDMPIIDGHVHFSHPRWMDDIIRLVQRIPLGHINFVSTLIEGKPTVRKRLNIPLDAPEYEGMWSMLETLGFPVSDLIPHWLEPDLEGLHDIALPRTVLAKIYRGNLKRLFGPAPAPLQRSVAIVELERLADTIDTLGGSSGDGKARDPAREVIGMLQSEEAL